MNVHPASVLALLLAALVASPTALARSSDRNQVMDIEAANTDYSMDERQPTVLSGNVVITQGTLRITAARAEITQRNGEPARVVLSGGPVRLNQQLDNGKPVSMLAGRADYDLTTEVVVLTGAVKLTQPSGSLAGERVVYNMRTGQVNAGSPGAGGRVRMQIQPRNAAPAPKAGG